MCRNAPSVSCYLLMIPSHEGEVNATSLRQVLDDYCANSGQLVSRAKSSIFFSPNTDVLTREAICLELDIMTEAIYDK